MLRILPLMAFGAMSACVVASEGGYGVDAMQENPVADASFGAMLNTYRATVGAQTVTFDARLSAAAQSHAQDMVDRDYFSHNSPEGETVEDRMIAEGYSPTAFGENIAGRQVTETEVLNAWIASDTPISPGQPTHKDILEGAAFEDFGLGLAVGDESRWVLVMGAE